MQLEWGDIVGATRGRILGAVDSCAPPTGWSLDSRSLERGDCFFAIRGPNHDGHRFASAAAAAGASLVVLSDESAAAGLPAGCPALLVEDTTRALQDLGAHVRRSSGVAVAAITGSVGKTTTKELAALLLAGDRPTHASAGNLNNHYGLPLTLLRMPEGTRAAVLELGISTPGEMDRLVEIAEPELGLVTLVTPAHVGNFERFEDYAEEKMKLPRGSRRALLNADDPQQRSRRSGLPERTSEFGEAASGPGAMRLAAVELRGFEGSSLSLEHEGGRLRLDCPLPGAHQARNLAAAAAVALAMGAPAQGLAERAAQARPAAHRGELLRVPVAGGTALLVDETYNSSPEGMRAALELLRAAGGTGRRLLVAGDMLELGGISADEHRRLGELAAGAGLDLLLGVGPEMRVAVEAAQAAGLEAEHAADAEAAAAALAPRLRAGDVVLLKGSRGIGLERAVEQLAGAGRCA